MGCILAMAGLLPSLGLAAESDRPKKAAKYVGEASALVPACAAFSGKIAAADQCRLLVRVVKRELPPPDDIELPEAVQAQIDHAGHDFEVVRHRGGKTEWIGTARPRPKK